MGVAASDGDGRSSRSCGGPGVEQPRVQALVAVDHPVGAEAADDVLADRTSVAVEGPTDGGGQVGRVVRPAARAPVPASTISGSAPWARAATGVPQAIASTATSPKGSSQAGVTTATADWATSLAQAPVVEVSDVRDVATRRGLISRREVRRVRGRPGEDERDPRQRARFDGEVRGLLGDETSCPHRRPTAATGLPVVEVDAVVHDGRRRRRGARLRRCTDSPRCTRQAPRRRHRGLEPRCRAECAGWSVPARPASSSWRPAGDGGCCCARRRSAGLRCSQVEHEGEIGVVVGHPCLGRRVHVAQAAGLYRMRRTSSSVTGSAGSEPGAANRVTSCPRRASSPAERVSERLEPARERLGAPGGDSRRSGRFAARGLTVRAIRRAASCAAAIADALDTALLDAGARTSAVPVRRGDGGVAGHGVEVVLVMDDSSAPGPARRRSRRWAPRPSCRGHGTPPTSRSGCRSGTAGPRRRARPGRPTRRRRRGSRAPGGRGRPRCGRSEVGGERVVWPRTVGVHDIVVSVDLQHGVGQVGDRTTRAGRMRSGAMLGRRLLT